MSRRFGFVGFGEVAYHYSLGLQAEGVPANEMLAFYPGLRETTQSVIRAREAKVRLVDDPEVFAESADLVLSVTVPAAAISAAAVIMPALGPEHLYADLNSTSPRVKRALAHQAAEQGIPFADVAILDAVPMYKHRVPLASSGDAAEAFAAWLRPLGAPVRVLGAEPGLAATFKMIRSIYMKGTALVLLETLTAAAAVDIAPAILEELDRSFRDIPFDQRARRAVIGTAEHAQRQAQEFDFVQETLEDLGVRPRLVACLRAVMEDIATVDSESLSDWQSAVASIAPFWREETK